MCGAEVRLICRNTCRPAVVRQFCRRHARGFPTSIKIAMLELTGESALNGRYGGA